MAKRVTCHDVARTAGVSRTAVSAVVNGTADRHGIAPKTQQRVQAVIRQLGYVPNRALLEMFLTRRQDAAAAAWLTPDPLRVKAVIESALTAAWYRIEVTAVTGGGEERQQGIFNTQHSILNVQGRNKVIGWRRKREFR